ncbi:hypothetical protein VOLCADRAFT_105394 [Volvox carteri f. nagariensis]|uniref:Uncharacterized protein n=1 Tax=Volvox carteri f. nagariensis TaxID=3068 RepID=D8U0J1_VOLCA|nr:uncharacterized protein VOLCADRAFT_105394 [Volvox carteri f. nagariensis]EFJ46729.1 hypothetical protein VOLCADRAFT_105394 [Volvox carteri f. nagariensis]|eukprot:XP_002952258.1 hypothetical protein VOLCADRAFT_105394 [Volvox carteri f. nagariensis]
MTSVVRSGVIAVLTAAFIALIRSTSASCNYEIWIVDQADSNNGTALVGYGGYIYIFQSRDLKKAHEIIDLGGEVSRLCFQQTGSYPVRPHMLLFNRAHSHAVLAFVASGHVVIFRSADRQPLACFRTTPGFNGLRQAHAGIPTGDDKYIVVANQNGKKVERINVDWENEVFKYDMNATFTMYGNCTTPSNAPCEDPVLRPDNAPICTPPGNPPLAFITLRGGGMFVLDYTKTPMQVVAEYDKNHIGANGCGGVAAGNYMYINSGGGTPNNLYEFKVYKLPQTGYAAGNPPNTPVPKVVADDSTGERDAHYAGVTYNQKIKASYFWQPDRAQSVIDVFSFKSDKFVNRIDLKATNLSTDPTPDALAISPLMDYAFVSLRGLYPMSADPHVSTGSSPGLGILRVIHSGRSAQLKAIVPIENMVNGTNRADPHALGLYVTSANCPEAYGFRRQLRGRS